MIYIEIKNNKVTQSTKFEEVARNFKNVITTDFDDYTPTNNKYIFEMVQSFLIQIMSKKKRNKENK